MSQIKESRSANGQFPRWRLLLALAAICALPGNLAARTEIPRVSHGLHAFEIAFDLEHEAIFLQPDPHFRPDLYRYTTVGIQFARNEQDTYSVVSVWKGSPADEASIRMGDRIRAINGQATSLMSTEQFSAQLHGEEGTRVNLIMERGGAVSAVTLHTR